MLTPPPIFLSLFITHTLNMLYFLPLSRFMLMPFAAAELGTHTHTHTNTYSRIYFWFAWIRGIEEESAAAATATRAKGSAAQYLFLFLFHDGVLCHRTVVPTKNTTHRRAYKRAIFRHSRYRTAFERVSDHISTLLLVASLCCLFIVQLSNFVSKVIVLSAVAVVCVRRQSVAFWTEQ